MKKWLFLLMTAVLAIGMLVGCGGTEEVSTEEPDEATETTEPVEETTEDHNEINVEGIDFPVTITDATGKEVTIEAKPETLITLMPSNTEILYALGLWDNVIAVTDNDDFPEDAKSKESVGAMEFDVEKIISLQPDLVLANVLNAPEGIEQIRNAGITVIVIGSAASFDDVYQSIETIGIATGTLAKSEEVINEMKQSITDIQEKASQISEEEQVVVWVEIWAPELYTTGQGTFMHEMLGMINAINAAGDQEGWPMFTEEDAVKTNPDIIITTYGHVAGKENAVEDVLNRPAWQEVSAVKSERVFNIEANIVERPGPRLIEGVEKLAETIYPEIFAQ